MKNDPMKVKYNKGGDSMLGRSGYAEGGKEDERNRELATADKERATQIEYAEFANDNLALKIAQERSISQLNKDAAARQENEEAAAARLSETMLDENMDEAYDKAKREEYALGSIVKAVLKIASSGKKAVEKAKDKVSSVAKTNFDDAVTKTGEKSKGLLTRKDGSAFAHMGDDVVRIASNQSQYKGAAKMAAAIFGGQAAYDKLTEKKQSAFESAFSDAHNAGEETFEFQGKAYSTEVKKGKMAGGMMKYNEGGSMLVPPEMEQDTPVDTYPNIPEDEMAVAEESQLPDSEMETEHLEFVLNEALDIDEQEYLMGVLETDERLSGIFDKVMDVATEFSGEGEVDGPGTGVSDSIPARLSDGEFVFTKKATDQVGADQLQTMMDEAEKAYDGGLMKKAFGGLTNDPLSTEKKTSSYNSSNEIKKQMISANQMPSIR